MSDANNSASEVCAVTTNVTSSDVASSEKLEHSGERYEYVQVKKKFKKQNNKEVKDILLTNKFERLEDEPVFLSKLEVPEAEARNKKGSQNKSTNQSHLVEESHILQDVDDESITKVLEKVQIMETPKRKLKKCRFCNFKKRSCLLNQGSCQAKKKSCWSCQKIGHFTQPICCKKEKKK